MKCYISGKITGLSYEDAFSKFENAEKEVEKMGYIPVNPMKICPFNPDWSWEDYMVKDIEELFKCQAIFMLKDWGSSKGARCEYSLSKEIDIKIIFE